MSTFTMLCKAPSGLPYMDALSQGPPTFNSFPAFLSLARLNWGIWLSRLRLACRHDCQTLKIDRLQPVLSSPWPAAELYTLACVTPATALCCVHKSSKVLTTQAEMSYHNMIVHQKHCISFHAVATAHLGKLCLSRQWEGRQALGWSSPHQRRSLH